MKLKSKISQSLRKLRLLHFSDLIRYNYIKLINRKKNKFFTHNYPNVKIPFDYLVYESFQLDYEKYYIGGEKTAIWMANIIKKYKNSENLKILDWGCGPGRVIRHLPDIFDKKNMFFGTDYNENSIKWCSKNIDGVNFSTNELSPPLSYNDNFFDVIYGISIFTHLSEKNHYEWIKELHRVLNEDGVLILTTQGDNFKIKLNSDEIKEFEKGNLVFRGNVKEGHRVYSAFHPEKFMKKIFKDFTILEHIAEPPQENYIPQDIWIIKK